MSRKSNAPHPVEVNVRDKYEFLRKIGKGSYGEVWLVVSKTVAASSKLRNRQQVLKRMDLRQASNDTTSNDIEVAEREAKLLSALKHPNIVAYTESFRSSDGFLNIVMAYCEGGDLYTKLKERKTQREPLSENQIIEWFIQICMALQYIHDKNILHRDLKTQNVFLTKNDIVKVGDLGIARVLDSARDLATTIIGTPYYMSPEILSSKPYGQKTDIWSLGCCLYEMMTFEHPFNAKDIPALISKIISNETPQLPTIYSQPLRDIVGSLFKKNPDERPTAKHLLQKSYIKEHILRLLEKTRIKCENQVTSKSQPVVSSSTRPTTATASSPSKARAAVASNASPILPSYPAALPHASRMPLSDPTPSREPLQNPARVRRTQSRTHHTPPMHEQDVNLDFIKRVQQNDTLNLQRRTREQRIHDHLKQQQQQESSPARSAQNSASRPPIPSLSPQKQPRASSVESNPDAARPPTPKQSQVSRSCDLNQEPNRGARERRRQMKSQSASTECMTPTDSPSHTIFTQRELSPPSVLDENLTEELEKKKEGEKDVNDFMEMLTATLHLTPSHAASGLALPESYQPNVTNSNPQNRSWSSGDRTTAPALHETGFLHQRCNRIRQQCLQEISPAKLKRVLKIAENVSEAHMAQEMRDELGEDLYNKYSGQIFSLKFYEDALLIRT